MAGQDDEESESNESSGRTETENTESQKETQQQNSGNYTMTDDQSPREELKESFDRNQLVRRNIDQSIDTVLRLNPVDNILKNIGDDEIEEQARDQVQSMMNDWLGMYRDTLEEGRTLPADLIGRSAELARESRNEPREETGSGTRR